jgi:hypothetical protein
MNLQKLKNEYPAVYEQAAAEGARKEWEAIQAFEAVCQTNEEKEMLAQAKLTAGSASDVALAFVKAGINSANAVQAHADGIVAEINRLQQNKR